MANKTITSEAIIEPDLPIVDPHHHLWFFPEAVVANMQSPTNPFGKVLLKKGRYLLEELLADVNTGHNVCATVFAEAHAMYRPTGPAAMKSIGEVEFITGVAAMAATGLFGEVKVCAAMVGNADLMLGDGVEAVLRAHMQAAGGRYRGIRNQTAYDSDPGLAGLAMGNPAHILLDKQFRTGFKWLQRLGLSFDAWLFEPQLPELTDLARAFPETQIILDHVGTPMGVGGYAGKREERFSVWRENIRELASCHNVAVKVGGLGMPTPGFKSFLAEPPATSEQLAVEWRPYVETCIEAFGANRCMFESNFPVDAGSCTYPVLWNTFKRLSAGASKGEKTALFSGTATRIYRLEI